MSLTLAALFGLLEGLTEFLPVSSTGHLIALGEILGLEEPSLKSFHIVIQLGPIVAVLIYFRAFLRQQLVDFQNSSKPFSFLMSLLIAFFPAALLGLVLRKTILASLFSVFPVALAFIAGGLAILILDRGAKVDNQTHSLLAINKRQSGQIGLAQCLALWPGVSRSLATILGGLQVGLSRKVAAEFSFLLAIPTLGAATLFEAVKARHTLFAPGVGAALAVGFLVSFLAAMAVLSLFMRYIRTHTFRIFGIYRIVLGSFLLLWVWQRQ